LSRKIYPWTDEELKILREKYPIYGSNIPELLETHPKGQLINKASEIGIRKFTPMEAIEYIKKHSNEF